MALEIKGRIPRGRDMEIRVQCGPGWKNLPVVDIRWFKERILSERGQKKVEMCPTAKGVRMNMEEAKHVYNVLERIMNEISQHESVEDFDEVDFEQGDFQDGDYSPV